MILLGVVEHLHRIAVECDLHRGKRAVALVGHRLQVAGDATVSLGVIEVSEGS